MKKLLKRVKNIWDAQTFSSQLTVVFLVIFSGLVFTLGVTGNKYFQEILEKKIEQLFQQTTKQTGKNIDTTLSMYKTAVNELAVDRDLLWTLEKLGDSSESKVKEETDEYLEDLLKSFLSYKSDVRFASIETANGKVYSVDRTQNGSIYRNVSDLHEKYFDEKLKNAKKNVHDIWIRTEYLDRVGTKEYYVYTYGKPIYNWNINQYLGSVLVSIEERTLAEICKDAIILEEENTNSVFIVDSNGYIVSHENQTLIGKKVEDVIDDNGMIVFQEKLSAADWTVVNMLNQGYIYNQLKEVQKRIAAVCTFLGMVALVMISFVSRQMTRSVKSIVYTMNQVEEGQLSATVGVNSTGKNEMNLIAIHFNEMMNKVKEQMEEVKRAGEREKEAEIRALEAQINPHFIYNTLDSINWLAIENGQDEISNMLSQFAQILRYQIQKSNVIVSIEEELGYLNKYLYLQKKRFMDSFEYMIDCEESVKYCQIHKMIFQPFIENSILHGCSELNYGGLLKIQIRELNETHLKFIVADNGKGMEQEKIERLFYVREQGNSIGISNVLSRLDAYYGKDYSISVSSMLGSGTKIEVIIPKECKRKNENENFDC